MYIDPDLVINKNIFKSFESYSVCSICNGIIIKPIQCLECENVFCQSCIDEWKKKTGENSWPFRCNNPTFKNSRIINNLLDNLIFKCSNGCNIEIPYKDIEQHYNEKCPKIKIDYKEKYLEYKKKYEDILKKYEELNKKNQIKDNNEFKSKFHIDKLYAVNEISNNWKCNICKTNYIRKTIKRFRCACCDFNLCLKCKILEEGGYNFNDENNEIRIEEIFDRLEENYYISSFKPIDEVKNKIRELNCNEEEIQAWAESIL